MEILRDVNPLPRPGAGETRVLIATMGALHEGHRALLREGRRRAGGDGQLVASIFLNPLQFNSAGDLESYPVTWERDVTMAREEGVDVLFAPQVEDFYEGDHSVCVVEERLAAGLCGASRPGHFRGVLTVVMKLFQLLQPTEAGFGKKDYQQLALIRRMVRDLNVPVVVWGAETVRESSGLARSSRNERLMVGQREDAARIWRVLQAGRAAWEKGMGARELEGWVGQELMVGAPGEFALDYVEVVDAQSLQKEVSGAREGVLAVACFYGEVRLIDNVGLPAQPNGT